MDKQKLLIGVVIALTLMTAVAWFAKPNKGSGPGGTTNWNWSNQWTNRPGSQPPSHLAPPPSQPQPKPTPTQPKPEEMTSEPKNYEDALRISAASGKPVLVYFTAPWCKYCNQMKQNTLPDPQVQAALKKYVYIMVNKDLHPALARKLDVSGIPAFVVVDSKEQKLRMTVGFKSPAEFTAWLTNG